MQRRETGILGEQLAAEFLKKRGYRVLETNYRCPEGEVDIIALYKDTLVFVEVRSKRGRGFGTPAESITRAKMTHLRRVAARYGQTHTGLPAARRIDVVSVELGPGDRAPRIELIENAVQGD